MNSKHSREWAKLLPLTTVFCGFCGRTLNEGKVTDSYIPVMDGQTAEEAGASGNKVFVFKDEHHALVNSGTGVVEIACPFVPMP